MGIHSDLVFIFLIVVFYPQWQRSISCTLFSPPVRYSDYNYLSRALNFAVGKTVVCQNITIRDDTTQEMDESFFVSLTRHQGLDSRIMIDQDQGRVTIIDSDRERERERKRERREGSTLSVSDLQLLKWDLNV